MKLRAPIFIMFTFFTVFSCSTFSYNEPLIIVDIEDEINVRLVQQLDTDHSYTWIFTSPPLLLCSDSHLITSLSSTIEAQSIVIEGIETATNCDFEELTVNSEEKFVFLLDKLDTEITLASSIVNTLTLEKSNEKVKIIYEELDGISIEEDVLSTINPSFIWGGLMQEDEISQQEFNELLSNLTEKYQISSPAIGNYGYFVQSEKVVVYDETTFRQAFVGFSGVIPGDLQATKIDIEADILNFKSLNPELDFFVQIGDGTRF